MSEEINQQETINEQTNNSGLTKKMKFSLPSMPRLSKSNMKIVALLVIAALLGGGFYYLKGYVIAATVNGAPISRIALIKELERQGGETVLDSLITETLITQEAAKKNVDITQAEIDTELQSIEQNTLAVGMTLDDALAQQNMTRERLIKEIKLNKQLEKLVEGSITVSDEEVAAYMEENKDALPANTDEETLKNQVRTTLRQQKYGQSIQELIAALKQNAKVNYYVTY
ncbi:hypothetical protein A2619_02655 [candidate division WWE3 bacterium RIFOXYD1_FULL_39_9]|uniref:SurA N-terminal domain-containing protein n=1 Tax=candidate division WWE3 bacterium RIFOXYD1_FULL_39_9 TaxID=1802649 RepID=A0A1F4X940_UNCKA|nr:MAG: hypothetical protein A2619_02655 [candidate division WWE3 bacterium RIFOXYD1_FULL_39_9]